MNVSSGCVDVDGCWTGSIHHHCCNDSTGRFFLGDIFMHMCAKANGNVRHVRLFV